MGASTGVRQRRHVFYRGSVQGVGFRFTTRRLAQGFDVGGFVRNLPDGRVELVVEGNAQEIDRFLLAIDDQMQGLVRSKDERVEPPSGEFSGFGVRF